MDTSTVKDIDILQALSTKASFSMEFYRGMVRLLIQMGVSTKGDVENLMHMGWEDTRQLTV